MTDTKHTVFLTPSEARAFLNIGSATLDRWVRDGKLTPVYTPGGHRRFEKDNLISALGTRPKNKKKKLTLGYCRVSTHGQKEDLERQEAVVTNYCERNGYSFRILKDIGSGINCRRKGFQELLELICLGECERIVVNYQDRLVRFGFEMLETVCREHGTVIEVINRTNEVSDEAELVEDVLSIITVFSAKLYGQRSHRHKQIVAQNKALFRKENALAEEKNQTESLENGDQAD